MRRTLSLLLKKAELRLLVEFRQHYLPLLVEKLRPLDEPQWKKTARAEAILEGYADCVVSAAKVSEHTAAGEYLQLIASGYSPAKIRRYFSYLPEGERQAVIATLEKPIKSCVAGVHNEHGILWLANGHVISW